MGTEQSTAAGKAARRRYTDYYVRQLRDWKYSAPIERRGPAQLSDYGELCAWPLARARARTALADAVASGRAQASPGV